MKEYKTISYVFRRDHRGYDESMLWDDDALNHWAKEGWEVQGVYAETVSGQTSRNQKYKALLVREVNQK